MRIEIQVYKDDGELVNSTSENALQPTDWKTAPERPVVEGDYRYFGFTYQPMVTRSSKSGGF